jgi:phospholipase/carboxylesterase
MSKPELEYVQIETGPNPTASVIWMHGLGADGSDFVPIVRELDLAGCPAIRFIFPHAPMMQVTINGGYTMRAWYDVLSRDFVSNDDEETLRSSQALVEELIAQEKSRGIAADKIVLGGFSQGGAMTLQTGLRHPETLAGLLVLSSYLPMADLVEKERNAANQNTSIFMVHGTSDQVINFEYAKQSADKLKSLGYPVEWHEYMMPHSLCREEIDDISAWFQKVLKK